MTTSTSPSGPSSTTVLPLLPLRSAVLFPQVVVPLALGRERSIALLKEALANELTIAVVTQRDADTDDPDEADLYRVGTSARILKAVRITDDNYSVIIQGQERVRLKVLTQVSPYLAGEFEFVEMAHGHDVELEALFHNLKRMAKQVVEYIPDMPKEAASMIDAVDDPVHLCDFLASNLDITTDEKQQILGKLAVKERLQLVVTHMSAQLEVARVSDQIQASVKEGIDRNQREFYLREQLKAIRSQLGGNDQALEALADRLRAAGLPPEVEHSVLTEVDHLRDADRSSIHYAETFSYCETLVDLPWSRRAAGGVPPEQVRQRLEHGHHGLREAKRHVLEYLAVRDLSPRHQGAILCFVGPPGVGKTSMARSIAYALNRPFVVFPLAGVRDTAEIRGHRRSYQGARPGQVIQGLRKAGCKDAVVVLDEIDKLGADGRDVAATLLDALDPELNTAFVDAYVEHPFDLSEVLFIATANRSEDVYPPLLSRLRVIDFDGYHAAEKESIARTHLWPRIVADHGLTEASVDLDDDALTRIVVNYTREAGLRGLQHHLRAVCRGVAQRVVGDGASSVRVDAESIPSYLGPASFFPYSALKDPKVGRAHTALFGRDGAAAIYAVDCVAVPNDVSRCIITGDDNSGVREVYEIASTIARTDAVGAEFRQSSRFDPRQAGFHVHVATGVANATEAAGLGAALVLALISALSGVPVHQDTVALGRINLLGEVHGVARLFSKLAAADRARVRRVLVPAENRADVRAAGLGVNEGVELIFVDSVSDVLALGLAGRVVRGAQRGPFPGAPPPG